MAASGYTPISLYYSSTPAAEPAPTRLVNGELALNIHDGKLFYKDNNGVVQTITGGGGTTATYVRTSFNITAPQTTFFVSYTIGYIEVYLNGVLLNASDYTANNETSVILASAAISGDIVETIAFNVVSVAASGTSGFSGFSGFSGSGVSGYSGATGAGISGFSGYSGYSGTMGLSGYSITESGGKLVFKYGATTIASLDSSGNFIALNNITAYGTP